MFSKIFKTNKGRAFSGEGLLLDGFDVAKYNELDAKYKLLEAEKQSLFRFFTEKYGLKGELVLKLRNGEKGVYLHATKSEPKPKPTEEKK
jgi:hypothetical protein